MGASTRYDIKEQRTDSLVEKDSSVGREEIDQLVKDFKRSCGDYHVSLRECNAKDTVVGPSVIRLRFRLGRGQALQGLSSHLEDIGREMKRTGVIIQQVPNSDELLLDVPRLKRERVLFKDVICTLPEVTSPEQLYFPLGRTPNGTDLFEDLGQMPHMLVGGSTGSGKSVFLFTMLASMLMTHPCKEELQLIIEVKSILSFNKIAQFPTVFSERANRQLGEIKRLLKSGHKVCYMFVSMYFGVKQICINEEQEEYCKLFRECVENGMTVCAVSLGMKESTAFVKAHVDVRF